MEHPLVKRGITPLHLPDKYKQVASVKSISTPCKTKPCQQHKAWEGSVTEILQRFFLGSLKLVQSPAEAQRIDTPRDQWLLLVSQQDMVESMLNDLRWECCYLCVITTFMPTVCQCWDIPVSDSSSSPSLLPCHELASPTVLRDRDLWECLRSLCAHCSLTFPLPSPPWKAWKRGNRMKASGNKKAVRLTDTRSSHHLQSALYIQ